MLNFQPHRRYNLLQDKWVLISPHRFSRPWSGQIENLAEPTLPKFDPGCYLCPNNIRQNGEKNPAYKGTFVFINDFSALTLNTPSPGPKKNKLGLFTQVAESGVCEVVCYSKTHNQTMASMRQLEVEKIVKLWQKRYAELSRNSQIKHIQIFENRGIEVGNSNLHPHGQIWCQKYIPTFSQIELNNQTKYFKLRKKSLLLDYVKKEITKNERVVFSNSSFTVLVPFWAEWPYETLILPNFRLEKITKLKPSETKDLSKALWILTKAYAKLFNRPKYGAPYTMGIHQQPTEKSNIPGIQLHFHFQPPLLTPNRQKFMVGYERFSESQRDLTAEQAAQQLKSQIK